MWVFFKLRHLFSYYEIQRLSSGSVHSTESMKPLLNSQTPSTEPRGMPGWLLPPGLRGWWKRQSPARQDRFAMLAPLGAVLIFLTAIVVAFGYLRIEEIDREREAVKRDVEYAHQRLRLRLLEQQEQMSRIAREVQKAEESTDDFLQQAESLMARYPELSAVHWIDARMRYRASYTSTAGKIVHASKRGGAAPGVTPDIEAMVLLSRELAQPVYSRPILVPNAEAQMQLYVPMAGQLRFDGVLMADYGLGGMLRRGTPPELDSKYAVSIVDEGNRLLAGSDAPKRNAAQRVLPWLTPLDAYEVPISPVGNGAYLRAQPYRASPGVVGSGLFWLVAVLGFMTAWMLLGNWRHTRRRLQAQSALVAETNFRRAMENSMLTGMRALDQKGRITYVNPAFCAMTGWTETELVGRTPPFPYWPDEDRESLQARLDDELQGRSPAGGIQVRVKRKDASVFDARMYVSPLIDAKGTQTGWMTSVTDITEPNRVREQLASAYERFTIVLDALDAAVSVTPLGSAELLFANKTYRQWFGGSSEGHLNLVAEAGAPAGLSQEEPEDTVDGLAGLPADEIVSSPTENAEVLVRGLNKWLEVRSRYLTWVDGRLAQMVISTDITARRLAEDQSEAQAERAQSASRLVTMGEMASSVAHELNQPLTAITNYCNGMVSRIKSGQIDNDGLIAALGKTSHQAQRAGQIIQRIRSFVKRSEPNRVPCEVGPIVNEALELAEIELRRRNVRISPYVAARLPRLNADPILIEQVLVNLLKNAGESIDSVQRAPGRRSVELRVVPKREGDADVVEFNVIDTGRGLAPEVMERLYEAFFSTKAEGMGIGLNLCRSIVESHQGRMEASNLYNGSEISGCHFRFWLPVLRETSQSTTMSESTA
jgi:PAS domain S-box-containing protein